MARKGPATIEAYIDAAPPEGQALLRELYKLLKKVAPKAEETIKWGTPFFVNPRFVFAFSAHKKHASFAPTADVIEHFADELKGHVTTQQFLKLPYDKPFPAALVRKIAKYRLKNQGEGDGFW